MVLEMTNRQSKAAFAYNGEQAVDKIQQAIIDNEPMRYPLIMMDCNMPFMDGYEATKQIRQMFTSIGISRENQPRIVAVTGHVENEYVTKAIASGMDRVYQKPLQIIEFGKLLLQLKYIKTIPQHLKGENYSDE